MPVYLIVVILFVFLNVALKVLLGYFSGRSRTGFVIDPEADHCQKVSDGYVNSRDFIIGHVLQNTVILIKSESLSDLFYPTGDISR